jgi:hypothetical protein
MYFHQGRLIFEDGQMGMGVDCCCTTVASCDDCYCDQCENDEVACCYQVSIRSVVDGTCTQCGGMSGGEWDGWLNKDHFVTQVESGSCEFQCNLVRNCCGGHDNITLSFDLPSDEGARVEINNNAWEKTFGTSPVPCCDEITLTPVTTDGDCDISGSTCNIRPFTAKCTCPWDCPGICAEGYYGDLTVDFGIDGWSHTNSFCACVNSVCAMLDGEWDLSPACTPGLQDPYRTTCVWTRPDIELCPGDCYPDGQHKVFLRLEARRDTCEASTPSWRWEVEALLFATDLDTLCLWPRPCLAHRHFWYSDCTTSTDCDEFHGDASPYEATLTGTPGDAGGAVFGCVWVGDDITLTYTDL